MPVRETVSTIPTRTLAGNTDDSPVLGPRVELERLCSHLFRGQARLPVPPPEPDLRRGVNDTHAATRVLRVGWKDAVRGARERHHFAANDIKSLRSFDRFEQRLAARVRANLVVARSTAEGEQPGVVLGNRCLQRSECGLAIPEFEQRRCDGADGRDSSAESASNGKSMIPAEVS